MLLSEAHDRFLRYCAAERNHSLETIKAYRQASRRFLEWMKQNGHGDPPMTEITPEIGRDYLYHLHTLGIRPRTVLHLFLPLRALYRMLIRQRYVSVNPFLEIELPKKDAARRLLITEEELEVLLEAAGRQGDPMRAARDQAVFAVMIFCGLRRSELLNLCVADINLEAGTLLVRHGKGEKSRRLPLNDRAKEILARWLAVRPNCDQPYLFTVDYSRRLAENGLKVVFDNVKAIAGYKGTAMHVACHTIRHAVATRLMRNGADLATIQHFLGHAQIGTTSVYLHTHEEDVLRVGPLTNLRVGGERSEPQAPPPAAHGPKESLSRFRRCALGRR
jgi:site-specific recombinase XerD